MSTPVRTIDRLAHGPPRRNWISLAKLGRLLCSALIATLMAASLASAQTILYRVNAGGPQLVAADGSIPPWSADPQGAPSPYVNAGVAGDLTYATANSITLRPEVPASVPMALFQTERWDALAAPEMRWSFPVSNGTYRVRLLFADIYPGTQVVGLRVFDVAIEGVTVLDNYDQYAEVGGYTGTMKSFIVNVFDGNLDIEFLHVTEQPAIKGIEIVTVPPFEDIGAGLLDVYFSSVAWGDYDDVGDLDLLLTGYPGSGAVSRVYRNTGGTLTDINAGLGEVGYSSVAWGDYDNDGDLDFVLAGRSGSGPHSYSTLVYQNTGGNFADVNTGLPGVYGGALAWGDYDNDGDLDLVLTGDTGSPGLWISRVYRNDGGGFSDIAAGLPAVCCGSVAWGDYDNDHDLDLLLTGYNGVDGICSVYRNDNGTFVDINAALPAVYGSSVAWGDYDNDGDLDLALTGTTDGYVLVSRVYQNVGGNFADVNAGLHEVTFGAVAWGDYDNDGDLDLLLTGTDAFGSHSHVYRNSGANFADINAGLEGTKDGSVAWGDHDSDGDLDLVLTGIGNFGPVSRVYRNRNVLPPNTHPTAPTGLSATFGATAATFRWSAATDAQTPSSGLSYNLRIGTTPGGGEIMSPMAHGTTGYRKVAQLGNVNENLEWSVSLARFVSCNFYWSVQAVDNAFAGSPFAPEQVASLGCWSECGVALSAAPNNQITPAGVADGVGGAIVAWANAVPIGPSFTPPTLSIGRVNGAGARLWGAEGVGPMSTVSDAPRIISDGAGGAVVTWADYYHQQILAVQLNAAGVVQWAAALCTQLGASSPALVADGAGGAIIAWHDSRSGTAHVYAQRVGAGGAIAWMAEGVPLSAAAGSQSYVDLTSDGSQGAIVTWFDTRNGNHDVYAQRIGASGAIAWATDAAICTASGDQDYTPIVSDGAGGAIIAWHDGRAADRHIYVQRVDGSGTPLWTGDGVSMSDVIAQQGFPALVADGEGGAIVAWEDLRNGPGTDIYGQRVSATGGRRWAKAGVPLCTAIDHQTAPKLVADGAGGALATWQDQREGDHTEIYAQHVADGAVAAGWPADGLVLCDDHYPQQTPAIVSDAAGGAIVAWEDRRSGGADLYATRVRGTGSVVLAVPPAVTPSRGLSASPNPFRSELRLSFELPAAMALRFDVFDLSGRRVKSGVPVAYSAGPQMVTWDGRADDGARTIMGVYFVRVSGPGFSVTRRVVHVE